MSRKGHRWHSAVAECCSRGRKKERIAKQAYKNRELALPVMADYVVTFCLAPATTVIREA